VWRRVYKVSHTWAYFLSKGEGTSKTSGLVGGYYLMVLLLDWLGALGVVVVEHNMKDGEEIRGAE
jgi:hypothetical protein